MKSVDAARIHAASFRDPSGFLFYRGSELFRQVNLESRDDYDLMMRSGLYGELTEKCLIVRHNETAEKPANPETAYRILKPEMVPFISHPYEWCFSQIRDAALATLDIQKTAMNYGMSLKDASAYNIQFIHGNPVLVDTLSFEKYREGAPWVAYRQFCQHFLAPLALMAHTDIRLSQLLRIHIDGIPLDLASRLLPRSTALKFGLLTHIHLHAKTQKHYADKPVKINSHGKISKTAFLGIIDSLRGSVLSCNWKRQATEWRDYYSGTNYTDTAMESKIQTVTRAVERLKPGQVWDLGANNGVFSRISAGMGAHTVSLDKDESCVEDNYMQVKRNREKNILPLLMDFTNPSPGTGWANIERDSLADRGPADLVLALALIHHLAISSNVPLGRIAAMLRSIGKNLIIEFVPKNDSQAQRLLLNREDIFRDYGRDEFERQFRNYFRVRETIPIPGTERTIYLMEGLSRR
ncbi:MAG TPA: class I SAM-dependent methyltransferase [Spirochaetota bacterium]|nr:class I SAM-dependent methyltransferase [Spirochaetota bacterium]